MLASELELAPRAEVDAVLTQAEEVGRMLTALRRRLVSPPLEPGP
ncbi:hypothetical protein [uncultured Brevundimonas sp.]